MAPKPIDAQALAEDVRKLIKRVDELETEKKNLVRKSAEQETELKILRNRSNDLNFKAEAAEKRSLDLETKLKAVDHNALARLQNSRLANANTPLTPMKDFNTNLPIKKFPKHEKDVRLMSANEVITTLTALQAPTNGTTGEQKTRVREYIGLPPASAPKPTSTSDPNPAVDGEEPDTAGGAQKSTVANGASKTPAKTPAKTPTKAPAPLQAKKGMTMEERKAAGIKAAREKAENDRKMGGRAAPKKKKVDKVVDGAGADVNGVKTEDGKSVA